MVKLNDYTFIRIVEVTWDDLFYGEYSVESIGYTLRWEQQSHLFVVDIGQFLRRLGSPIVLFL